MPEISRGEIVFYVICVVVVGVLGVRALRSDSGARVAAPSGVTTSPASVAVSHTPQGAALVHVVGAVRKPGVYRLKTGDRVRDAVRRAGGSTSSADLSAINLAAKLADAQQVIVPLRASMPVTASVPFRASVPERTALATRLSPAGAGVQTQTPEAPISLGSATLEQLDTLDGVGPATAKKIIDFRTAHGGFSSVDQLGEIPGIGPKRLENLRARLQP